MTARADFQLQILEKLGVPLVGAVGSVSTGGAAKPEAEQVAELLGKAVQAGLALAEAMDVRDADPQGDAVRLAVTGLAAGLIGEQYRAAGKPPGETEIRKTAKAMQAVLAFADNFAPAAESTARLEKLQPAADETQAVLQYAAALAPVVSAIGTYSFGRAEYRLAQEVAERLALRAETMAAALMPPGQNDLRARRGFLALLARTYADCHREETQRLMRMPAAERDALAGAAGSAAPMDPLWEAFERRVSMLTQLAAAMNGAAAVLPPPKPVAVAVPAESAPASYNPMTFFGARGRGDGEEGKAA